MNELKFSEVNFEANSIINTLESLKHMVSDKAKIGFDDGVIFNKSMRYRTESFFGDDTTPLFKGLDYLENKILNFKANLPEQLSISDAEELLTSIKKIKGLLPFLNVDLTPYSSPNKSIVQEKVKNISQTIFEALVDIEKKLKINFPPTGQPPSFPGDYTDETHSLSEYSSLSCDSTDNNADMSSTFTVSQEIFESPAITSIASTNLGFDEKTGPNNQAFHIVKTLESLVESIKSNKIKYDDSKKIFNSCNCSNYEYYYSGADATPLLKGFDHLMQRLMILHSLKNQELSFFGAEALRKQIIKIENLIPNLYDINLTCYNKADQKKIEEKVEDLIQVFLKTKTGIYNGFGAELPPVYLPPSFEDQEGEFKIEKKEGSFQSKVKKFIETREEKLGLFRNKFIESTPEEWDMKAFFIWSLETGPVHRRSFLDAPRDF